MSSNRTNRTILSNLKFQVRNFARSQQLLSDDGLHLVALSGGADSVALMLVLKALGYRIEAAHCNFHLRGEESDRDEEFVKVLCKKEGVPLHLIHFETSEYASLHKVSIEMAARELRYRYFAQLIEDIGAETVCVAHHRDDAVETFLMNLLRGAGIHGLTGIRPRNGNIVRPLLCVSRKEIVQALDEINQSYVIDSTNLEPDVLRNKIRLQLIPLLQKLNPAALENIACTSYYLSEAEKVYNAYWESAPCAISSVLESPSPLCALHEKLTPLGFNRTQLSEILEALESESGKEFSTPSHTLVTHRGTLVVEPNETPMKPLRIPEAGLYRIDETTSLRVTLTEGASDISRDGSVCTVDAAKVRFPLTLRTAQPGDRFIPYGMKGSKLISDFLTDQKLSVLAKRKQKVMADATGMIFWVVGFRTANPCRITPETTSTLRVAISPSCESNPV